LRATFYNFFLYINIGISIKTVTRC